MKVGFRKSFIRDLKKVKQKQLLQRVKEVIVAVEGASNLDAIAGLKRLRGETEYARIRIGDYRIGLKLDKDTVIFVRCLHRREIYRYFP